LLDCSKRFCDSKSCSWIYYFILAANYPDAEFIKTFLQRQILMINYSKHFCDSQSCFWIYYFILETTNPDAEFINTFLQQPILMIVTTEYFLVNDSLSFFHILKIISRSKWFCYHDTNFLDVFARLHALLTTERIDKVALLNALLSVQPLKHECKAFWPDYARRRAILFI